MVTTFHYLLLAAALFTIGVIGVLTRRNIMIILMSIELMMNAVNINLIAFSSRLQQVTGQVFAIFVITVAAAEAAVGLGFVIAMSKKMVGVIACTVVFISFIFSAGAVFQLLQLDSAHRSHTVKLYEWINAGPAHTSEGPLARFQVDWGFLLDPLSSVMILVVTGVGFLIHVYSTGYMHDEDGFYRFFAYLNLFMFSMLTLVLGNNYLMMFIGWEGVGLCSYLLIGYYFHKRSAGDAAKKAFIVNRVGDWGLSIGIMLIFVSFGSLEFTEVGEAVRKGAEAGLFNVGDTLFIAIAIALFIGATGKSAQIPLFVWLPDAMEGPTPVSALIHAATMVTAGIYMIARSNVLYSLAPISQNIVAVIGLATAILAALIALKQNDIKRVLAYSTVSQLGYMFLAMGVGAWAAGIFHLMTHAFFKACLFLGSGSVIHAMGGEQDMRKMGGLRRHLPATSTTFIVATLAIAGIPPLAGFFSKDEILWQAFSSPYGSTALWAIGLAVAGLTAFYMFRQVFMVFFGECRADHETRHHLHESPAVMTIPLWILMAGSIVAGLLWLPFDLFVPFERWLAPVMDRHGEVHAAAAGAGREALLMLTSLAAAAGGIGLAYRMYASESLRPETFSEALGGL